MTVETKTTIEFRDIHKLEIERIGRHTRVTRRLRLRVALASVALGILVIASCDTSQENPSPASTPPNPPRPAQVAPSPTPARSIPAPTPLPAEEQAFVSVISNAHTEFNAAPNEMAQGGTRPRRRAGICRALSPLSVSNWIGKIGKLGSNSDGKGVLEIALAEDIRVETWNNDFSDSSDHTLIDPSSSLFAVVSQMKEGDQVKFSGSFIASDLDCVKEKSVSLSGSMTDPEFIFRFTAVSATGSP